jgi:hypothetical protein
VASRDQLKSRYYPQGDPKSSQRIAQVFFPTNVSTLDRGDRRILDRLVNEYLLASLAGAPGTRISLRFQGHADHRGSADYNLKLAQKRVESVRKYVASQLGRHAEYFNAVEKSFGEEQASADNLDFDRRVDILSSYVKKRRPKKPEPKVITPETPPKRVRRPTRFVDFEHERLLGIGAHDVEGPKYHYIVIEKWEMIDEERSFPYDLKQLAHKRIASFPEAVVVYRYQIRWRKPRRSDTAKKVAEIVLKVLSSAAGTATGWDFGTGVPTFKPPNIVYSSWDELKRKSPKTYAELSKYRGKF